MLAIAAVEGNVVRGTIASCSPDNPDFTTIEDCRFPFIDIANYGLSHSLVNPIFPKIAISPRQAARYRLAGQPRQAVQPRLQSLPRGSQPEAD